MSLINFNSNYISGLQNFNQTKKEEAPKADESPVKETKQEAKPQVSADDVLSYMANASIMTKISTANKVNPAKYVDAESKVRISESIQNFEKSFEIHFNQIVKEMPGISESTAMMLASKMVEDEI